MFFEKLGKESKKPWHPFRKDEYFKRKKFIREIAEYNKFVVMPSKGEATLQVFRLNSIEMGKKKKVLLPICREIQIYQKQDD